MDALYTQDGDRPDLAAIEVNPPEGYIGEQIFPVATVLDKSGTVYYATVTADSAAQTGRNAGTAPTGTQISDSSTTYTCAEVIKRGSVTPDEAKQMGGLAKADEVGAKWAKRQVQNYVETLVRNATIGVAKSATFDPVSFRTQAQTALDSVRRYEGQSALVTSTMTLKKMVEAILGQGGKTADLFARIVSGSSPTAAVSGFSFAIWREALAMWAGVDVVLSGDNAIWNATNYAGKLAIVKIPPAGDPMSHKWMPVLGKTFTFLPDGSTPWMVESIADRVNKNNHYDAQKWVNVVTLNSGALYVMDGAV